METKLFQILVAVFAVVFAFSGSALAWGVTDKEDPFAAGKWLISMDSAIDFSAGTDTYEPEDGDSVDTDIMQFGMGVRGGYFVVKGLEIGPSFRMDYQRVTAEDDNVVSVGDYVAGLHVAYYYATPVPIHPFVNLEGGYAGQFVNNMPDSGDDTTNTASGVAIRPSVGAAFFFTDKIALTPAVYYQYTALTGTDETVDPEIDYDQSSSRVGFQLGLAGIF